jgi:hypothetical protein
MTDDFDKIIEDQKALNERVIQLLVGLKSQADEERKVIAALNSEREVTQRAVRDLQDERSNLQAAANTEKAELIKTQNAIIDKKKLLEEYEAKLRKWAEWKAA